MTLPKSPHRKRVRHYHDAGHVHELTFSCYHRRPLLTNDHWRGLLSEAIDRALERHHYSLAAFVYMPEHVHLLLIPGTGAATIGAILKGIKRPFSFRIKCALQAAKSPLLDELTIRQRPSIETFRYWQEGPGYDRNLDRAATVMAAIDYIHLNPVRRGLVARTIEWLWSSARWYDGIPNDGQIHFPRLAKLPMEFLLPTPR